MTLETFLTENRTEIIERCRARVRARGVPKATDAELAQGIPLFLAHLTAVLARDPKQASQAGQHGRDLLNAGFTIAQVVHDYGDVCQSVTELAIELETPISNADFQTLNRVLDDAIAEAVTEFVQGTEMDSVVDVHALAQDVRTMLSSIIATFALLRTGSVGLSGATGNAFGNLLTCLQENVEAIFTLTLTNTSATDS